MIRPRLLADVKAAEGCKLRAYRDSRGFWTIAYGHLLSTDKTIDLSHVVWTQEQADEALVADLETAQHFALGLPEWPNTNECLQDTLTELVFNMGLKRWKTFVKCRAAFQNGDLSTAAHELQFNGDQFDPWYVEVGSTRGNRLVYCLRTGNYLP